jgi:DNA helicase-2/ATP-dependent DNA helicase PcrA
MLPGIGGKGAEKLWQSFNTEYASRTTNPSETPPRLATAVQGCMPVVPKKALIGWAQFAATIAQLEVKPIKGNASKMIRLVIEAGYEDYLKETYDNYRSRLDDLQQLAIFSGQFASLEDFLTQLALLTNLEAEEDRPARDADERLRLSTIHQAKGLEFDAVFVIMLCDGLFPLARVLENQEAEEEERRLFYVAITRARNELYFTYPLVRAAYGSGGDYMQQESRFLKEVPKELLEVLNLRQHW